MKFESSLIKGTLIKRYKRFLADVTLENGSVVTVHVANPGSMLELAKPGTKTVSYTHLTLPTSDLV